MIDLRNGIAVVTGASSGLGRALAIELTLQGVRVAGIGRRNEALIETQKLAQSGLFTPVVADVSDPNELKSAFDTVISDLGAITILINNAAVYPHRDFLDETPESYAQTVAINLGGTVNATHAALQSMTGTGIGRIINVSSFADIAPLPASGAYSVSKGAQRIFTRALIADISDRFPDIVVNTWMPGMLATDMGLATGLSPTQAAKWGAKLALWHDRSLSGTTFEMDRELPEPRSLKRRIRDKILRSGPKLRHL
ncbi:SDR family NAD(P)-dependent oxidoreductase [Cochlodiniinecator piscidefendens]|uniref:SDR family NAD(P)-dependent oxidoreductase n=1 Tax=Cochlodiniinecator piscidefendens TaxID=2715756 RepID=UPI00140D5A74|nr:SDR family oxidoreductase [Cochlodiniinecator piscidefendens]